MSPRGQVDVRQRRRQAQGDVQGVADQAGVGLTSLHENRQDAGGGLVASAELDQELLDRSIRLLFTLARRPGRIRGSNNRDRLDQRLGVGLDRKRPREHEERHPTRQRRHHLHHAARGPLKHPPRLRRRFVAKGGRLERTEQSLDLRPTARMLSSVREPRHAPPQPADPAAVRLHRRHEEGGIVEDRDHLPIATYHPAHVFHPGRPPVGFPRTRRHAEFRRP